MLRRAGKTQMAKVKGTTQSEKLFDRVYELVRRIPMGQVTTYGEVARALGMRDARMVGWALHANNDPKVPCHRVVNRDGRLAPNFAFDGPEEQRRRLSQERITFVDENHVDMTKYLWKSSDNQNTRKIQSVRKSDGQRTR